MIIRELLELLEAKGQYSTFKSWKAAVKKKFPEAWIEGDEDIAQAMVGPKPYKHGETKSVAEWDGAKGELFEGIAPSREQNARNQAEIGRGPSAHDFKDEYEPVLMKHGFKKSNGKYVKYGLGEITINKIGHWDHMHVGPKEDLDYEGSTAHTLDRHLTKISKGILEGSEQHGRNMAEIGRGQSSKDFEGAVMSFSDYAAWKAEAKERGLIPRRVSGHGVKGNQVYFLYDGNKKVGQFSDTDNGRGGWIQK